MKKTKKKRKYGQKKSCSDKDIIKDLKNELEGRDKLLKRLFDLESAILNTSREGIVFYDKSGKIIEANTAVSDITGIPLKQIFNKPAAALMRKFLSKKNTKNILDNFQKNLTGRKTGSSSYELEYNNKILEIRTSGMIKGANIMVSFIHDITERKTAEINLNKRLIYESGLAASSQDLLSDKPEALNNALKHLLDASETSRAYLFENFEDSIDGLCMKQTHEALAKGVTPQIDNPELVKLPYSRMDPDMERELSRGNHYQRHIRLMTDFDRALLEPQDIKSLLLLPINVSGKWTGFIGFDETTCEREWSEEDIRLIRTAAQMIGIYFERKLVRDYLQESEEKFSIAFNAAPVLMAISRSRDEVFLEVNKTFLEVTGCKKEEIIGRSPSQVGIITNVEQRGKIIEEYKKNGAVRNKPLELITKSGEIHSGLFSGEMFRLKGASFILTTFIDLTEQKKLEQQLIRSEKLSATGQLAAGIAHEFNNILAVIQGYLDLARIKDADKSGFDWDSTLDILDRQVGRAGDIVSQLMVFARPAESAKELMDLCRIIEDVISIQKKQLEIENIAVMFNKPAHPVMAPVNSGQLHQVFLNLFLNSRHAVKPNNKGAILIELKEYEGVVEICFKDDGTGMDEKTRSKIFTPFFTTKGAFAKNSFGLQGTGLGLSVSHMIIKQHGGTITFQSKEGEGTQFIILLPMISSEGFAPRLTVSREDKDRAVEIFINKKILLVDDEAELLSVMEKLFRSAGCKTVAAASNGPEAFELLEKDNYDFILLDMILPGRKGEDIIHEVRGKAGKARVFFMTGNTNILPDEAVKKGADGLIYKPFNLIGAAEMIRGEM